MRYAPRKSSAASNMVAKVAMTSATSPAHGGLKEVGDQLRTEAERARLDEAADGGEDREDDDRDQHHRRGLVGVLDRALRRRLAGERHPPHAPGVEAGDQGGDETEDPDRNRERVVGLRER